MARTKKAAETAAKEPTSKKQTENAAESKLAAAEEIKSKAAETVKDEKATAKETKKTVKKSTGRNKAANAGESADKQVKKTRKSNSADNSDVFLIQSNGMEYSLNDIREMCKEAYRNGTRKQIKTLDVYLKYESGMMRAYYVVNGKPNDGLFIEF